MNTTSSQTFSHDERSNWVRLLPLTAIFATLAACGGGGGGDAGGGDVSGGASATQSSAPTSSLAANQVKIYGAAVNRIMVSVTLCTPGSNTSCQTIDNVLVDTGSTGFRLVAPQTVSLPDLQVNGSPVSECKAFAATSAFGHVRVADVHIGGETAPSVPIEVLDGTLDDCTSSFGPPQTTDTLGANAVLGIWQPDSTGSDCSNLCALETPSPSSYTEYYNCVSNTCTPIQLPVTQQVRNPVAGFPQDNTGVVFSLSALPSGSDSGGGPTGTLTFGVGTQGNNSITGETVFTLPMSLDGSGTVNVTLDSGTPDMAIVPPSIYSSVPLCSDNGLFCPNMGSTLNIPITGSNGVSSTFVVPMGNGDALVSDGATFEDLVAANTNATTPGVYLGAPFFAGRTIFFVYPGATTPSGVGPYVAF